MPELEPTVAATEARSHRAARAIPAAPPRPNTLADSPTPRPAGDGGAGLDEPRQPIVDAAPVPLATTMLELRVRNHPGAMSHITGLFARRAFNLEAIVCIPEPDHRTSRTLLLVADDPKLEQVERQLAKLHDVLEVRQRPELGAAFFAGCRW